MELSGTSFYFSNRYYSLRLQIVLLKYVPHFEMFWPSPCLLYTSDAADESEGVDLGGRRIIKKKRQLWVIKLNQLPWSNEDLEEKVTFLNKKE